MKKYIIYTLSLLTLILAFACEKIIDVELPSLEKKLVIEGEINSNFPAIVILSYNMNYFDVIDSSSLSNMYITDNTALVTVSDGSINDTLTLQTISKFPYQAFVGTSLLGEEGKTYTLNVSYQDKDYHSTTSIPTRVPFSQVWFEPKLDNDSIGLLSFSFWDNANENNYYSATSLVIGKHWWYYQPVFGRAIFDDIFFNGDTTIVQISKGTERNDFFQVDIETQEEWDSIVYFTLGESVSIRLATLDRDYYLWWNSLMRSEFTGSNPYSNPSSVLTNIEGDPALGVWGGYANTITNIHITDSGTIEELNIEDIIPLIIPDMSSEVNNN